MPETNTWNMYGLKDNPFTTDPLTQYGEELPISKSFVGREKEREKIKRIIHSNKSSRLLVYGDIGVGKTSLVNYVKFEAAKDSQYLTLLSELGIQYDWTPEDFMAATVRHVYATINQTEGIRKRFNGSLLNKLAVIFGGDRGYNAELGASIHGMGGSIKYGKSFTAPRLDGNSLKLLFQEILSELMKIGYKGTIIHYNNLELVQDKGENQLKRIMNGVRDFLQVKGAHFVFVSDKTLYEMFQQLRRVEDIFQVPIIVEPFELKEIENIIGTRFALLKIEGVNPVEPFDAESLKILFGLYQGNLRGILRSLDATITDVVTSRPVRLNSDILRRTLFKIARNRYISKFSKKDGNAIKILRRILEKRETTNKAISEHFKMKPQNVSSALTELREVGAIKLSREEGRSRYYVPSQEALWLLLEPPEPRFDPHQLTLYG